MVEPERKLPLSREIFRDKWDNMAFTHDEWRRLNLWQRYWYHLTGKLPAGFVRDPYSMR